MAPGIQRGTTAERPRAARKCSAAKIVSATASKTGPSTRTFPAPEAAANRARTRESPATRAALPAPIIPQATTDIDVLPVVENETEAGSEPTPCGAYSGHTTHERRRILQEVGLAIALSSSDPSARSLRPGLTATEIHSLWGVLHPAREARARHSTVARRFERAITLAPPPSASTAAYLDGPLPAQLDREPESRDEGNRAGDHPRPAGHEVGIDHHRESRDELRRAPLLLAVEEDAQADESDHHRREERGRIEAHRRAVSGVRLEGRDRAAQRDPHRCRRRGAEGTAVPGEHPLKVEVEPLQRAELGGQGIPADAVGRGEAPVVLVGPRDADRARVGWGPGRAPPSMVGHVVAVGQEHPAESAELLDALDQRGCDPGRGDEDAAAFTDEEIAGGG